MTIWRPCLALTVSAAAASSAFGQKIPQPVSPKPIEVTVCQVVEDPSRYNNKFVSLRALVKVSEEYSILEGEGCKAGIWFMFGDGSAPPGLISVIKGKGVPGSRDAKGRPVPPIPIRLNRDANYQELIHYLEINAKAESCLDRVPPGEIPDCTTYRIKATFSGRIDSVSQKIHAAHLKRKSSDSTDFKGFGNMGLFDAQLVVQSIENVVAADTSELNEPATRPSSGRSTPVRSSSPRLFPPAPSTTIRTISRIAT